MLNISWGTKIAALYIGFVSLIVIMVFMSMNQKIDLVSSDYYQKELEFQTRITEMNNANALHEKVSYSLETDGIHVNFPSVFKDKIVSGEIRLFCPADASRDYSSNIELKNLTQIIRPENFSKGMYKMQISWSADATSYFVEEIVVIP